MSKHLPSLQATRRFRRAASAGVLGAVCAVVFAVPSAAASPQASGPGRASQSAATSNGWVAAWAASPVQASVPPFQVPCTAPTGVTDQTVRDVAFTHIAGDQVQVRLTNTFGSQPLAIGSASVALAQSGAQAVPGTLKALTFAGAPGVTIAAGAEALSDPVAMNVPALQDLLISVFVPGASGPATEHFDAQQDNYVSTTGDFTQSDSSAAYTTDNICSMFVDGVNVHNASAAGTVVALGDSITDGAGSTLDANTRWPDDLARRLVAQPGAPLSVANAGISGNCLLETVPSEPLAGVSALARFQRDVLEQPGVRTVILLEGLNDIGTFSDTADQIIAGYVTIINWAHANGIRVIGGTLTPIGGSVYYSTSHEQVREAVNLWILFGGAFDGTVDFDGAVLDPANPLDILPAYDSGDHLHLNDAGYQAMANAVNLQSL